MGENGHCKDFKCDLRLKGIFSLFEKYFYIFMANRAMLHFFCYNLDEVTIGLGIDTFLDNNGPTWLICLWYWSN